MKPARDSQYLAFIRSLPCLVCRIIRSIEAAHTGPHGLSTKASDYDTVPLCRRHHKDAKVGLDKIGRRRFEEMHHVSIARALELLHEKPVMRLYGARWTGLFHGEEYLLGTALTPEQAAMMMERFRREAIVNILREGIPEELESDARSAHARTPPPAASAEESTDDKEQKERQRCV